MIQRRSLLSAGGAAALSGVLPARAACPPQPGFLGRGFHLGEVLHRPQRDFDDMAAAGATLLRFGLPLRESADGSGYDWPAASVDELGSTLERAGRLGLRVVPVLRPQPDPQSRLWVQPPLQDSLDATWQRLARLLKGNAQVAAYDLVNESHPSGNNFVAKERSWADVATRLIRTIRAEDAKCPIVYEPSPGARPMAFRTVQPLPFDNIVYSVHFYEPFEFTHQRTGDARFRDTVDFPGGSGGSAMGAWDAERLEKELAPVRDFELRSGRPIYVGEFGAVRWAPGGARERYLAALMALFSKYRWSWTYHAFREWHGWDAEANGDEKSRARSSTEPAFQILTQALRAC